MKLRTLFLWVLLCSLLFSSSCKKWRNNREPLTSEDHTLAEASFNEVFRHLLIIASPGGGLLTGSCFSYTGSGSSFPDTVTVNFGSDSCTGLFEFSIYGKATVVFSDSINRVNAVMTATPLNLYIENYKVEGSITISNAGLNASGYQEYNLKVTDGMITAEKEKIGEDYTIAWECNYYFELLDDNGSSLQLDDLHRITGTASGLNEEDRSFAAEIIEPLQKYVDCRWPGSGKTKISPSDLDERDLNYGDCNLSNCCDNVASEDVKWPDKAVRMK